MSGPAYLSWKPVCCGRTCDCDSEIGRGLIEFDCYLIRSAFQAGLTSFVLRVTRPVVVEHHPALLTAL